MEPARPSPPLPTVSGILAVHIWIRTMNNASKGRCVTITPSDRLREHYAFRLASAKRKSPARALGAPLDTFPDSTGMAERRSPIRRVSGHFCDTCRVGDRRSGGRNHAHRVGARKKVCPAAFFQTQSLMIMSKVSTAPHPPPAEPVSAAGWRGEIFSGYLRARCSLGEGSGQGVSAFPGKYVYQRHTRPASTCTKLRT